MLFQIDRKSSEPIEIQIMTRIRSLIAQNMLIPGEKIPSINELATLLVVNPKNVFEAYRILEQEGMIEQVKGQGFFVCTQVHPVKDEKKAIALKIQLAMLVEEAITLGLSEHEVTLWVRNYYQQIKKM